MYFKLTLNSLNTFACAARCESFQQAAAQLHISPSAVSHQIRNMESLLGYTLFQRGDKKVSLTPQGRSLLQQINQPLHLLHQATEQALQPQQAVVRISCAPVFATRWLLPRLNDFQQQHPEIEISIQATTERVALESLQLDGIIRHGNRRWPEMHQLQLLEERSVIACRPALLKRHSAPMSAAQIARQPLLDIAAHTDRWQEWFSREGLNTTRQACCVSVENTAQAVEACLLSDLFVLLDANMIERELAEGSLTIAAEVDTDRPYGFSLLWSKQRPASEAFMAFHHWLATQQTGFDQSF